MTVIYGLIDPRTNQIRYVGRTCRTSRRFYEHMCRPQNTAKDKWIAELLADKQVPIMITLDTLADRVDPEIIERWWIDIGLSAGWPLVNEIVGGKPVRPKTPSDTGSLAPWGEVVDTAVTPLPDPVEGLRSEIGKLREEESPIPQFFNEPHDTLAELRAEVEQSRLRVEVVQSRADEGARQPSGDKLRDTIALLWD